VAERYQDLKRAVFHVAPHCLILHQSTGESAPAPKHGGAGGEHGTRHIHDHWRHLYGVPCGFLWAVQSGARAGWGPLRDEEKMPFSAGPEGGGLELGLRYAVVTQRVAICDDQPWSARHNLARHDFRKFLQSRVPDCKVGYLRFPDFRGEPGNALNVGPRGFKPTS